MADLAEGADRAVAASSAMASVIFMIGGLVGLVILAIYNRGRNSTGDKQ